MGLDGISINQISIVPQRNSAESVQNAKVPKFEIKPVDGLDKKQIVDPDKEHEHEKQKGFSNFYDKKNNENEENLVKTEEVIKYDLSKAEKYSLLVDEKTNEILILEKATNNIIQRIDADKLSHFVNFLPSPMGVIVNRNL